MLLTTSLPTLISTLAVISSVILPGFVTCTVTFFTVPPVEAIYELLSIAVTVP